MALILVAGAAAAVAVAHWPREPELEAADAASVAAAWVGAATPRAPRCNGGAWEIDVARPDGSLVEVAVGKGGELHGFDEERGPGGSSAPDEPEGPTRVRAIRAALAATGPGRVLSTERDRAGEIEVGLRRGDGEYVEVSLDRRFRDPGDRARGSRGRMSEAHREIRVMSRTPPRT